MDGYREAHSWPRFVEPTGLNMHRRRTVSRLAGGSAAILLLAASGAAQAQDPLPWQRSGQSARADDAYRPPSESYGRSGAARADDAYRPPGGDGRRYDDTYSSSDTARSGDAYRPPSQPAAGGYVDNYRSGRGYRDDGAGPGGYGQPYTQGAPSDEPGEGYDRGPRSSRAAYDDEPRGPRREPPPAAGNTYSQGEITAAGHRFFGSISQGLASVIEHAFNRSGRPNGYILGEDAGGAFVAGLRYGEGVLYTKDAGNHKVYWQGPSLGYDFGAEGSKTMVLVYNLRDPSEIFHRFGGIQGSAYLVGGVSIQFQQYGDVVLAPIRSGVGLRLGANVGYLKYTRSPTWNPF